MPIASAAKLAAPRAVFALPPRSRVAAITGADRGVLTVAASAFSPRTSTVLPEILVCPNAAPCFLCPYTRRWVESMSTNARVSAPGSSGARRASSASSSRFTFPSCATLPQVNERRNDPSVDGARTPANTSGIAPWRSTSISSIESAPAAIPATRQPIFASAFTPHFPATATWRRASA